MAKKRAKKAKSPMTITVRRVGETGASPAAVSGKKKGGYRGPSKAMTRMTGAVSSARKAAARAGQVAKAEPTRALVGTIAGSLVGKISSDMLHDTAVKTPSGSIANHEAHANAAISGIAALAGLGVALMGPQTVVKRYAVQTLSHVTSFSAGAANAINNQVKRPVTPIKGTTGTEGDDPFRYSPGDTGASRGERVRRRRQALAARMAERMRAEDPQGAGTEGPELEEYCGDVLDEAVGEIAELEGAMAVTDGEVGILPLAAAALMNPATVTAVTTLLKLASEKGKEALQARQADQPVTAAVLELEGEAPEELETGARSAKAKELRRERRELRRDVRTKKRAERKAKRTERRQARLTRKESKLEAQNEALRAQLRTEQARAARPAQRPIVIRTVSPARSEEPAIEEMIDEDAPIIIIPSDEEIAEISGYGN